MSEDIDRMLRLPEVQHYTGLAKSTIYAKAKTGEFPSPVKLTPSASAWRESEVKEWIDRVSASPAHVA